MTNFLIIRTSWVVSSYGNNFIKTILKLIKDNDTLNIVKDQFGAPTTTNLIGKITNEMIKNIKSTKKLDSGVYNLSPRGKTNWYQMANKILERAYYKEFLSESKKVKILPIDTINYPTKAKRPKNSLLDTNKIERALNIELPYWESEFNETIDKILEG